MPRPAATPEQREQVRNRIRAAAAKLASNCSLEDISARAIATEAGVSIGTIYSYFENLSDLAQSLWMEPVEKLRSQLDEIAETTADPVARIRALLEAYAGFAHDKHGVYRGAFLFVRPDSMKRPDKANLNDDSFYRQLKEAITEGQRSGQVLREDPDALAQTLWAGLHGALALPINLDRFTFKPSRQLAQHMIDTLLNSVCVNTKP
jgi:AcrR family transcriptional regulator